MNSARCWIETTVTRTGRNIAVQEALDEVSASPLDQLGILICIESFRGFPAEPEAVFSSTMDDLRSWLDGPRMGACSTCPLIGLAAQPEQPGSAVADAPDPESLPGEVAADREQDPQPVSDDVADPSA